MNDFELYSVNWQDGMLLTQEHLRRQERYFEELIRRSGVPQGDGYGLVRFGGSSRVPLTLNASMSGDRLRVELVHCQAITPGGYIIHISQDSGRTLKATATAAEGEVPVYVSVDPASRTETGDPDPTEDVPRMPYRVMGCALHVGEKPQVPEGQILSIARLFVSGGEVSHAPNYIPPAVTLFSDERLQQKAASLRNRLETLLSMGNRAYQTLSAGKGLSGEGTELKSGILNTVYQFVSFLSSTLDDFIVGRNAGHPMTAVTFHKKLFRTFHTLLNVRPGVRDYLHERYFVKEAGSDISRFMSSIDEFLLAEYNHEDIGSHIVATEGLLEQMKGLLGYMAQVKEEQLGPQAMATDTLTYSGRTYKLAPYSGTRVERLGELTYLEINLAEPRGMRDTVILLSKDLASGTDWSALHVRLGLNEARGLGETDPVAIDATSYGDKVALHPHDMLESQSVRKLTMIFRGLQDQSPFERIGKHDLIVYSV